LKERLKDLDYLRSFAVLAVIAIHITGGYLLNGKHINYGFAFLWNQGMRFAVPTFIIISGFLLFYYDLDKKKVAFNNFIIHRLSKIIIPYIIWTFFYSVYYLHNGLYELRHSIMDIFGLGFFFEKLFVNILQGTAAPHLYFIVIILQLYILYPILHRLMKKHEKPVLTISFVITFYFQLADYLYGYEFFLLPKSGFKYYSILFFPWIFYFVIGMYTVIKIKKGGLKLNKVTVELSLLWILAYFILIMDSKLSNTSVTSIKPTIILYSIVCFYFLYSLSICIKDFTNLFDRFIKWFSSQSFFIYLSHILVLSEIRIFTEKKSLDFVWNGSPGMILLFISVTVTSCIIVYILSLIPFIKVFGGVYSKNALR